MEIEIAQHRVELPDLSETLHDALPVASFHAAADGINEFADAAATVRADAHLSDAGKTAKVAPLADRMLDRLLTAVENLEHDAAHWHKREATLLEVGAPASANEVARDAEIRAWWRSASADERQRIMEAVEAGPEYAELVRALLRSPVPDSLDLEKQHFRALHDQIRRIESPAEAVAIEDGRAALAWAERAMGHAIGIAFGLADRPQHEIIKLAVRAGHERAAVKLFGDAEVARAKAVVAAEQRLKAA